MAEWTIESKKIYTDPFNDVDVDVVFSDGKKSWRVPAFWRGDQQWGIRFSPPNLGTYDYHLESTDSANPDLNGHEGRVTIRAYSGSSELLKHGPLRVSQDRRHFEQADGTPFYWLGDTWWTGLSSRLSWSGFQELTADRQRKGFTVVQIVAGLVPFEELCPVDPGCQNEGGPVWTLDLTRINPKFFDYADRRIESLVNSGIAPAIVGAWRDVLYQIGAVKIKKHWRYLVARYGAYPVFWIVGGEVFDPPMQAYRRAAQNLRGKDKIPGAWTDVAEYVRSIDPYHHPLSAHELSMDDPPLQRESLTDFRLFQPAHYGWSSLAAEVAQLNLHYARTAVTKPLVVDEIGFEMLGKTHLEDFQRVAFWLAMLNGAAGYTYGAVSTYEAYTADMPFQREKYSFLTWEEGMSLPGSYQIGLGAKLLRQYSWWQFKPHPEWVTPSGTTLFEARDGVDDFHIDVAGVRTQEPWLSRNAERHGNEWSRHNGDFMLPYAAGIPGETRVIYVPHFGLVQPDPPTIRDLEVGVTYHAYYWEPSLGIKVDLGVVERTASPGVALLRSHDIAENGAWKYYGARHGDCSKTQPASKQRVGVTDALNEADVAVAVTANSKSNVEIVLRFRDINNYVEAVYSKDREQIYLVEHIDGMAGPPEGVASASEVKGELRLSSELKGGMGIVSITVGARTITSPMVPISVLGKGRVGMVLGCNDRIQGVTDLEVRRPPIVQVDDVIDRSLYDVAGRYRGKLDGPGWSDYGKDKDVLLDAYRPPSPPIPGDWVLVLERHSASGSRP